MNFEIWERIRQDYKTARDCLVCSEKEGAWHREDEKGMYFLHKAYYTAKEQEEKDDLLYARILMLMNREYINGPVNSRFHKLIAPAKEACERAINAGCSPYKKELEEVDYYYKSLEYEIAKTENNDENYAGSCSHIDGFDKVKDFSFYDSKPLCFSHDKDTAELKIAFKKTEITLEFTGLSDVYVATTPEFDWIDEFSCYPLYEDRSLLCFDVAFYKIICKHIRVKEYTNTTSKE